MPEAIDPHATLRDDQVLPQVAWWESTPHLGERQAPLPRFATLKGDDALARACGEVPSAEPRYAVERPLGAGASGMVWAARDQRLHRPIAIKVLGGESDRARTSFVNEARITASLTHPNVLPVHDLDVTVSGEPCFVMRRIDGLSLGEALRHPQRDVLPAQVRSINGLVSTFIAVGQALAYAHHQGVIHQDVKPDNILIGRFGEVLLLDWGCAVRGPTRAGTISGTPLYMAPEQARREGADARSDLYALGASLFHALLGRPPIIPGLDAQRFWQRKQNGEIDPIRADEAARLPAALLAIIHKAMAPAQADRYAEVAALVADLQNFQAGQGVSAHRDGFVDWLRRFYRRHRSQCWTIAVAAILVLAAGAAWWNEKRREVARWREVLRLDFASAAGLDRHLIAESRTFSEQSVSTPIAFDGQQGTDLRHGRLELGRRDEIVNVITRTRFLGDLRVEWTATPLWAARNLNCFVGSDRLSGYTFHIGSWGDPTYCALTRSDRDLVLAAAWMDEPLARDRTYRFRLTREHGALSLAIDGRTILTHYDPNDVLAVAGQAFGFDSWIGDRQAVDDLVISTRPLPQRISPVQAAEAMLGARQPAAALRAFDDLAAAYADVEPGLTAAFRAATIRTEDAEDLGEVLAFARSQPRHPQAPWLWLGIHRRAQDLGAAAVVTAAREALVAYPGHPARARLLSEIGLHLAPLLRWSRRPWDTPPYPIDVPVVLAGEVAAYQQWRERYAEPVAANTLFTVALNPLELSGDQELLAPVLPERSQSYARLLLGRGQVVEAFARFPHIPEVREAYWYHQGNLEPLLSDPERSVAARAHRRIGDLAWLAAEVPRSDNHVLALLAAGRAEEALALDLDNLELRRLALIACGRLDEALAVPETGDARALACFLRGDEIVDPFSTVAATGRALQLWQDGDLAGAWAISERLRVVARSLRSVGQTLLALGGTVPLACDRGDIATARAILEDTLRRSANGGGRRVEFICARALGLVDDATFLARSRHPSLPYDLAIAQAFAAELGGDPQAAAEAWQRSTDLHHYLDDPSTWPTWHLAQWRAQRHAD